MLYKKLTWSLKDTLQLNNSKESPMGTNDDTQ